MFLVKPGANANLKCKWSYQTVGNYPTIYSGFGLDQVQIRKFECISGFHKTIGINPISVSALDTWHSSAVVFNGCDLKCFVINRTGRHFRVS